MVLARGFCIVLLFSSTWLELWTTTHCCDNSHIAWHLRLYKFFIVLLSIYLELFMLTIRRTAGDWPLSSPPKMYRPLQEAITPGKKIMILMDWRLINEQCSMFSPDWTLLNPGKFRSMIAIIIIIPFLSFYPLFCLIYRCEYMIHLPSFSPVNSPPLSSKRGPERRYVASRSEIRRRIIYVSWFR